MKKTFCAVLVIVGCLAAEALQAEEGFAFPVQDNMTWVFFGDSITAANKHTAYIESYYQLRYPKYKLHFRNSGRGGDQLKGAILAFDYRVAIFRPTHVSVELGQNGPPIIEEWGDQILELGKLIEGIGAKPVLFGQHPKYAAAAAGHIEARMKIQREKIVPATKWAWVDQQALLPYYQKNIAAEAPIDMQWPQRGGKPDLGHPGYMGHLCKAYVILKGLGAPTEVSSAEIDAASGKVVSEKDCRISDLAKTAGGIAFTRLDERLPMTCDDKALVAVQLIPEIADFNRYILKVSGLGPGKHEVLIDGVSSAVVDAKILASGWNMFLMSKGPIHEQLQEVLSLIKDKEGLGDSQDPTQAGLKEARKGVAKVRGTASYKFDKQGVKGKELVEQMKAEVDELEKEDEKINKAAQPKPRKFEIRQVNK